MLKGILMVDENVVPYLLKKLNVNLEVFSNQLDAVIDSYLKLVEEANSIFLLILIGLFRRRRKLPQNSKMNSFPSSTFGWLFYR